MTYKYHILIIIICISFQNLKGNNQTNVQNIDSLLLISEEYKYIDIEKAINIADEALKLSKKQNNKTSIGASLNNLGNLYYNKADYIKSLEYYNECLEINKELNDEDGIAKITNNIGVIHLTLGSLSEAFINIQSALSLYRKLHNKKGIASCLNNLGLISQKQNKYKESLSFFNWIFRNILTPPN